MAEQILVNAIELGVDLLAWYATSFSPEPDNKDVRRVVRAFLDRLDLKDLEIPTEREERATFLEEVSYDCP